MMVLLGSPVMGKPTDKDDVMDYLLRDIPRETMAKMGRKERMGERGCVPLSAAGPGVLSAHSPKSSESSATAFSRLPNTSVS